MIPYFSREDVGSILHYLGKIIKGVGILILIPFFIGVINKEWVPAIDFLFTFLLSIFIGDTLLLIFKEGKEINWRQGMSIVSLCWIIVMFLGAIPLYLSGHYIGYLDASFEAMSALATTGLTLVNDLDHMAYAYNFWRHLMCFIGGQGIILVALTLFVRGGSAFKVYVGEAREEKIMPNIIQTARFIWLVSLTYLVIGTAILFGINLWRNISPGRALFHAICLFMAGWDTAGFAVQSQNVLYYHSPVVELVTAMFFLLGAVNFGVHYAVWTGRPRELLRNYELKIYIVSILITFFLVCTGFIIHFQFPDFISFFREGFYQLISAHTGVGYSNITFHNFAYWPPLAILGIIIAMGLGGSSTSTSGGIKILRMGILLKGIKKEIKVLTSPGATVVVERFHHIRDIVIEDTHIKMAAIIIILYITLYLTGGLIGVFYGYPFLPSLFESVSASANVGLSMGITSPFMPTGLKITYIIQMWIGRLEFLSVFVLFRFLLSLKSPE
ncbi:MAG: TrkH family potassium uptake protein [Candidatus Omnitrophica bacterium]|nr:TrkH family potassium uptake protein [Candidatus Omnitrophota bacterium]